MLRNLLRFWSWLICAALVFGRGGHGQPPRQLPMLKQQGSLLFQFKAPIIPKRCSFQVMDWQGESWIAGINSVTNELAFFEHTGGMQQEAIGFSERSDGKIRSVQNWEADSLLVYGRKDEPSRELFILAPDGGRRYIRYDHVLHLGEPTEDMESLDLQSFQDMHLCGDDLYIRTLPYAKLSDNPEKQRSYILKTNLKNGEIKRLPLFHPKVYYQKDYRFLYDLTSFAVGPKHLILGFMGHPMIGRYDLRSAKVDSLVALHPELPLQEPPLENPERYDLLEIALSGAYGKIIYDPWQQVWFRMLYPPATLNPADAAQLSREELPGLLIAYDSNWKEIAKAKLPLGCYDRTMFPTPAGLAIQDLKQTDLEQNLLGFLLYKLE